MNNKSQYFSIVERSEIEYNVVFDNHAAYLDGEIRFPTRAPGGVENVDFVEIKGNKFVVSGENGKFEFDSLAAATPTAIEMAIAKIKWNPSKASRQERELMLGI